jgi:CO/xanthine dehydrogenase FAD-binding subunit
MASFSFFNPRSLEEAIGLLTDWGVDALPVAGATDLWVNIRSGKARPTALVSLRMIPGMRRIEDGGAQVIGGATPHADIEDSELMAASFPALQQACATIGSRQVRNVGTLGGNICNAAPCADSATALMLYDASVVLAGPAGARELALGDFFIAPGQTRRLAGEILTEIRVADPGPRTYSGYIKHTRRKGVELAMMSVGVRVTLAGDGLTVTKARISLGVCAPTPTCSANGEAFLEGKPLTRENVAQAAELAAEESRVRDSWRGRAWYRREMIRVLVPRVLEDAGAFAAVEGR